DLKPQRLRLRSAQTAGCEVDLIVEGARLVFTRWQIQCKNTGAVEVDDLAKEIGLAMLLHSHMVLLVTTGRFRRSVLQHARRINEATALQFALIDGSMLARIGSDPRSAPSQFIAALNAQAEEALKQKAAQIEDPALA